ncbi:WD40 repeat-like protein [Coniophora puteana RWD-64-598 SS2]|uniref:WD40 repeat-like protein n=1 Tax=Coniophora puteana (strain RWD-64-598) TaxID=741705 RepID=A0A5M3MD00_CONPW|nr:WD40 repeat-like protein [Coniophora puteana RWD-64-598 SS2]EIW76877.1 WD40 repeat-like protein [Coniophora puteana RWD-64-598 SS2]
MHGHESPIHDISYSPDGKLLISGGEDSIVRVWDTMNIADAPVTTIEHAVDQVWTINHSPDGRLIATGGRGKTLKVWDVRQKTLEFESGDHSDLIRSVSWEPSGSRLATGCADHKLRVFDLKKPGAEVLLAEGHRGEINTVVYSPNGHLLASGADDYSVRLWDARTGKPTKSPFRGHRGFVMCLTWSPDSTRIISGSYDYTVRVWDASNGQILFKGALYAHKSRLWSVAYSPDGKHFASADAGTPPRVQIWDARTGKASLPLISANKHSSFKQYAEEHSGKPDRSSDPGKMKAGAAILAAMWFPDCQRFASAGEEPLVRIWDAQTGFQVGDMAGHRESVNALSISADGTKLATASDDRTVLIFDTKSMQPVMKPLTGHDEAVYTVRMTPDGSRLVSGGKDKSLRFWNAVTGELQHVTEAHTDAVRALSMTKDGSKLASGGDDSCIYIWDMRTYERLAGPFKHDASVRTMAFSPDSSRLVSGSDDLAVHVWNTTTGSLAFDPIRVHTGSIGAVDWSPDGTKLLTAGSHDWTIWIWDAATGERVLGPLEDTQDGVRAAAFSPDGTRFVSGFMDHTLRMWDTATGVVLLPIVEELNSDPEGSQSAPDPPRGRTERGGVPRESDDDSIMNMPATVRRKPAPGSKGFWDDADLGGTSKRQGKVDTNRKSKRDVLKSRHKTNILRRFWWRRTVHPGSNLKGKSKEQGSEDSDIGGEELAMTHKPKRPTTRVAAARDKLRVLVAGDDPHARLPSQTEPESDEERDSPTGSEDPNRPDHSSGSDDQSEHGLVDTICFLRLAVLALTLAYRAEAPRRK